MRVNLLIILLSAALGALSVKTEFFAVLLFVVAPIVFTWAALSNAKMQSRVI